MSEAAVIVPILTMLVIFLLPESQPDQAEVEVAFQRSKI
jgi:hypothetical protein